MQLRTRQAGFVRTEGGLLPADLLERVRALDRKLPGLDEASYGLAKGERFGEATTRVWNRLVGAWATFQDDLAKLPAGDAATTTTRERFLLPLMEELGYGRLSPVKAIELDGKSYPVSHAYGDVPLHLVGANVPLDRRSKGVAGAAGQSPHGLVQELLNRSPERLWGIVSNGLALRILRDNASLTRQAYVEFDLEAIMAGEAYADFALLWHLAHRTRLEPRPADGAEEGIAPTVHGSYLERWSKVAEETGARARDRLRDGVQEAIEALGSGFLRHSANSELKAQLQAGDLSTQDYYRELLRLVYRLILLFVAEDRELLLDPKASPEIRDRYARYYSTARLRRLAERRKGSRHADLYAGLRVVIAALGQDEGAPGIGLPPLGGFLFGPEACPHLDAAELANGDLLDAIRKLATIEEKSVLRTVDYKNLASEELGSIYESLLERHPELDIPSASFVLKTAVGHERKSTGSYYTPSSLISVLLDSALDPVLAEAADKPTKEEAERAILDLSVVDPAAGSGHFLVAAAHRIAKRLAQVRTEDEEPAPTAITTALRDVIGHCLYAVDVNPMAVELCKVSLWLEALEPGKPLTFLDAHIKCGNSLLGTTPELIAAGIPDAAYDPIEGDDKAVAAALKKRNRAERDGQLSLGEARVDDGLEQLARRASRVDLFRDTTIEELRRKEAEYLALAGTREVQALREMANAWCVAFLAPKTKGEVHVTTSFMRGLLAGSRETSERGAIDKIAVASQLFHWFVEFPAVMAGGGFDVVLGNPPWAALSPDLSEFFSRFGRNVRGVAKVEQERLINELLDDPAVRGLFAQYRRKLFGLVHFLKNSGRYTLYAPGNLGKGDFNTYRPFVELALRSTRPGGIAAQVVPGALGTGANSSALRQFLLDKTRLLRLLGFNNQQRQWFDVSVNSFCIYAASPGARTDSYAAVFSIANSGQLSNVAESLVSVDADEVRERAPATYAMPQFANAREAELLGRILARWPAFGDETAGPPLRDFQAEVHMGNDRDLFNPTGGLPVFEGRMIDRYDYRAKTYLEGRGNASRWEARPFGDPLKRIAPQWFVTPARIPRKVGDRPFRYRIGYQNIADPAMSRSLVACLIPPGTICGDKVPTIAFPPGQEWAYLAWLSVANSFVMDYVARTRLASKTLTQTLVDSLPFPRLKVGDPILDRISPRALRLICAGPEMVEFWNLMARHGWADETDRKGEAPGSTDPGERAAIDAELEVIVARDLFGISIDDLEFIIDSFQALANEEARLFGEFRSKRLVLEGFGTAGVNDAVGGGIAPVGAREAAAISPGAGGYPPSRGGD